MSTFENKQFSKDYLKSISSLGYKIDKRYLGNNSELIGVNYAVIGKDKSGCYVTFNDAKFMIDEGLYNESIKFFKPMAGSSEKVHGYIAAWPVGNEKMVKSTAFSQVLKTLTFGNNFMIKAFSEPMKNLDKRAYNQIRNLPKKIDEMLLTNNCDLKKLNNELEVLKVYKKWANHVQSCEDFNKHVTVEITKKEKATEVVAEVASKRL